MSDKLHIGICLCLHAYLFHKGVPIRVEIGPRDVSKGEFIAVSRDNGERQTIPRSEAVSEIKVSA